MLGQGGGRTISQARRPLSNGSWPCLPPPSALISEVYFPFIFFALELAASN